jgi:hypothetical protein
MPTSTHRQNAQPYSLLSSMKDRSSFGFFLSKTTTLVLFPLAVLTLLLFAITTMQHGVAAARVQLAQLLFPELILWLAITFAMFLERRVSTRFTAMQDEIEELKERISHLETHR